MDTFNSVDSVHRRPRHIHPKTRRFMGTFPVTYSHLDGFGNTHRLMDMTGVTSTLAVVNSLTAGLSV